MESISLMSIIDDTGGGAGAIFLGYATSGQTIPSTRRDGSALVAGDYYKTKTAGISVRWSGKTFTFSSTNDVLSWDGTAFDITTQDVASTGKTVVTDKNTESISKSATTQRNINIENVAKFAELLEKIRQCGHNLSAEMTGDKFKIRLVDWDGNELSSVNVDVNVVKSVSWSGDVITVTKTDGTTVRIDLSVFEKKVDAVKKIAQGWTAGKLKTELQKSDGTKVADCETTIDGVKSAVYENEYLKVTQFDGTKKEYYITGGEGGVSKTYVDTQDNLIKQKLLKSLDLAWNAGVLSVTLTKNDDTTLSDAETIEGVKSVAIADGTVTVTKFDGTAASYNIVTKTYVDNGDATTLQGAKSYADEKDAATLQSAKDYSDANVLALKGLAVGSGEITVANDAVIHLLLKTILGVPLAEAVADSVAIIDINAVPTGDPENQKVLYRATYAKQPTYKRYALTADATGAGWTADENGLKKNSGNYMSWSEVSTDWENLKTLFEEKTDGKVIRYTWDDATYAISWETIPTKDVSELYHYKNGWHKIGGDAGGTAEEVVVTPKNFGFNENFNEKQTIQDGETSYTQALAMIKAVISNYSSKKTVKIIHGTATISVIGVIKNGFTCAICNLSGNSTVYNVWNYYYLTETEALTPRVIREKASIGGTDTETVTLSGKVADNAECYKYGKSVSVYFSGNFPAISENESILADLPHPQNATLFTLLNQTTGDIAAFKLSADGTVNSCVTIADNDAFDGVFSYICA